jgi:hypothetical protein
VSTRDVAMLGCAGRWLALVIAEAFWQCSFEQLAAKLLARQSDNLEHRLEHGLIVSAVGAGLRAAPRHGLAGDAARAARTCDNNHSWLRTHLRLRCLCGRSVLIAAVNLGTNLSERPPPPSAASP